MTVSVQVNHLLRHVSHLPVDPFALSDRIGLSVVHSIKGPDFYNTNMKIVSVQRSQSKNRQRFSAAFLLAHHALNLGSVLVTSDTFSSRNPNFNQRIALQFALELLVPCFALKEAVEERGVTSIDALSQMFQVSSVAVSVRLRQLDILQSSGVSFKI